jgi:septal ring factor EnvC (AmiA/AmiB activator)
MHLHTQASMSQFHFHLLQAYSTQTWLTPHPCLIYKLDNITQSLIRPYHATLQAAHAKQAQELAAAKEELAGERAQLEALQKEISSKRAELAAQVRSSYYCLATCKIECTFLDKYKAAS